MFGFLIAVLVLSWAFYGLHVLGLNRSILEMTSKPLAHWYVEPGNNIRALVWAGAIIITVLAWLSSTNSLLGQMQGEITGMAVTVIIIDELVGYRNRLERKQEIIDQIESPVRDVAVEATRLAKKLGFKRSKLKENQAVLGKLQESYIDRRKL